MSTANRLKKNKTTPTPQPHPSNLLTSQQLQPTSPTKRPRPKIFTNPNHSHQQQSQYQQYKAYKEANPFGISWTMQSFPADLQLADTCALPLGYAFSPLVALENQHAVVMEKSIQGVPRCGACRAYMNCFNTLEEDNKFVCFLCGCANYMGEYRPEREPNMQLTSSIYQAQGSPNFYPSIPSEQSLIFLIDVSNSPQSPQILHYTASALTQILSRPEHDDTLIQIYAYDVAVYQFGFTGEEVSCMVLDRSIRDGGERRGVRVGDCRKFFGEVFQAMKEICEGNLGNNSNFGDCFDYVYKMTRGTGSKYFIVQISELLGSQPLVSQTAKKQADQPQRSPVSILESRNTTFMDSYGNLIFQNGNSIAMFVFANTYKNLKAFMDTFKLVNSQLKYYSKDSQTQLQKFYYQLSFLLSATYFKDIRTEFLLSDGWSYLSVYSNSHRIRQHITFACTQLQPSRQYFVMLYPAKHRKREPMYCAVQVVVNYRYRGQHFVTVATAVQTITGELGTVYGGVHCQMSLAMMAKSLLSNLRTEHAHTARRRLFQTAAALYRSALKHYKQPSLIPDEIMYILLGTLSIFKSHHSQPEAIPNSTLFDRMCAERIYLHSTNCVELASFFVPYLFDLSDLGVGVCEDGEDGEFVYPPMLEAKFQNIRQGIFLLDNGIHLYLFIAKQCDLTLLKNLFGKEKLSRSDRLTEQTLHSQNTQESRQVLALIQHLREQKSYGWIPLSIVHCGEKSENQRNFYLQFTAEKYDSFIRYKGSFQEYLETLKKNSQAGYI